MLFCFGKFYYYSLYMAGICIIPDQSDAKHYISLIASCSSYYNMCIMRLYMTIYVSLRFHLEFSNNQTINPIMITQSAVVSVVS